MVRNFNSNASRLLLAAAAFLAMTPVTAVAWQNCRIPEIEQLDFPGFVRDAGEALHDSDTLFAFVSNESGGRDFNGNGSVTDFVFKVYDTERGGLQPVAMGFGLHNGEQTLVVRGRLAAFFASEAMQSVDLTRDRDLDDERVVMIWDADRQVLVNTQLVLSPPPVGSRHEPRLFIRGSRVVFTADEVATKRDLNGDRRADTQVGFAYDARTGQLTNLGDLPEPIAVTNNAAWTLASEASLGQDLNLDGDLDDSIPQAVDLDTGQRTTLSISSRFIRGEGDYLALKVSEADEGGQDFNGNGQFDDHLYMFWDTVQDRLANPGLAQGFDAIPLVMNQKVAVYSVWEGVNQVDLNGDGDFFDAILLAHELATGITRSLGISHWSTAVAGDHVVLLTREYAGHDYNGDGDLIDKVLHLYDVRTGTLSNTGLACNERLLAQDDWAVVFVNEYAQGRDLNGDGDIQDLVPLGLDLERGTSIDFGFSAYSYYAPRAGRGLVLASEPGEGRDLNGDGDLQDNVAHLLDLRSGSVTNLGLASDSFEPQWVGREAAGFVVRERDQGVDLNGDGDLLDEVTQIVHLPDLEWELEGAPIRGGAPVRFRAYSSTGRIGDRSYLFLSLGDGQQSGGIPLPGTSEKLSLEAGPLFTFWLQVPASLREADLIGCPGSTTGAFSIPLQLPSGLRIHYAGFSIDGGARISAVSDTQSFDLQ